MIRNARRGKGLVALGRVVLSKRERVIMLEPSDKGLIGTTLRYAYRIGMPKSTSTTWSRLGPRHSSWPSGS